MKTSIAKLLKAASLLLTAGRKDEVLKKYPALAKEIEIFVENDPSGNQKYLDWECHNFLNRKGAKVDEIVALVNLFDKYKSNLQKKDINQYVKEDWHWLSAKLSALDTKRQEQKSKYIDYGKMKDRAKSEIIYDSDDYLVRHIQNKSASVLFGLSTNWCTSMKDALYFEDYQKRNSVFFFLFAKNLPKEDPNHKISIEVARDSKNKIKDFDALNSSQGEEINSSSLQAHIGEEFSEIYADIMRCAKSAPKSAFAKLASGEATGQEIEEVFQEIKNQDIVIYVALFRQIATNPLTPDSILSTLVDLPALKGGKAAELKKDLLLRDIAELSNLSDSTFMKLAKHATSLKKIGLQDVLASNPKTPKVVLRYLAENNPANLDLQDKIHLLTARAGQ